MSKTKHTHRHMEKLPRNIFSSYVELIPLSNEDIKRYMGRNYYKKNTSKLLNQRNTRNELIKQECVEDTNMEIYETTIEQSTVQAKMLNVKIETADVVEVKTEQENGNEFICQICHDNFDNYEEFIVHKNLKHRIKPFVCKFCNAKFVLNAHLSIHLAKHVDKACILNSSVSPSEIQSSYKFFQCNLCIKSFTTRYGLNGHMKCHSIRSERKRKLALDEQKLKSTGIKSENDKFDKACILNSSVSPSEIQSTSKSYLNTSTSVNISNNFTPKDSSKLFQCNLCIKSFTTHFGLNGHMKCHSIRSERKRKLVLDMQKSTGIKSENDKLFHCSHCNINYKSKQSLAQHNRHRHSRFELPHRKLKSKTVECNWCSSEITKCNLLRHIKNLHPNINPIQCLYCPMAFKDSRSLKLHMSIDHAA